MALVDVKKIDAILALAREVVPRRVETTGNYEDWKIIAPALVGIGVDLFEGIASSPPPRGRIRAEVLARSLAEYAIAFAWLAAPVGGREKRIRQFLRDEYREREKAENKLADQIVPRAQYRDLVTKGSIPKSIMDDAAKKRHTQLLDDKTIDPIPNALEMAFTADEEWMGRVNLIRQFPFVLVYFVTFGGLSPATHPSITGIGRVVTERGNKVVVGMPRELEEGTGPYGGGYLALLNMLWVAAETFDWLDPDDLVVAMNRT